MAHGCDDAKIFKRTLLQWEDVDKVKIDFENFTLQLCDRFCLDTGVLYDYYDQSFIELLGQ